MQIVTQLGNGFELIISEYSFVLRKTEYFGGEELYYWDVDSMRRLLLKQSKKEEK